MTIKLKLPRLLPKAPRSALKPPQSFKTRRGELARKAKHKGLL
jgi:hypothetical protein